MQNSRIISRYHRSHNPSVINQTVQTSHEVINTGKIRKINICLVEFRELFMGLEPVSLVTQNCRIEMFWTW